jgi:peroxiredoxin
LSIRSGAAPPREIFSIIAERRLAVKLLLKFTVIMTFVAAVRLPGQTAPGDSTTLTRVGQIPPDFSATTLDGRTFTLSRTKGRVVLLNFFATWCAACKVELPELQKNLSEPFKESGLAVICIGREHTREELEKFRKENGFKLDFVPDPARVIFKSFATQNIPRNVLIGKDGTIRYQSLGYSPEGFKELIDRVAGALKE